MGEHFELVLAQYRKACQYDADTKAGIGFYMFENLTVSEDPSYGERIYIVAEEEQQTVYKY